MAESVQIVVAEKSPSLAGLIVGILEGANYQVAVATTEAEAVELVNTLAPSVVLSSVSRFDGEGLCKTLRKRDLSLPIALLYPPTRKDNVEARARMFGADLVLMGPVQAPALLSAVRLLVRLRRMALLLADPRTVEEDDGPGPLDLPTFKRMLNIEVRKSRRYRFPAAFLLLQLDLAPLKRLKLDRRAHSKLIGTALAGLTRAMRDIDLCVHSGNDRFIVFMPHTPSDGAQAAASRLHARVRELADPPLSWSVGVAAYDGQGPVSFGSLLRDASLALDRARDEGGDRVELAEVKKRERVFIA